MKPHSTNEQKLSLMHMCSMWIPVSSKWDWTPLAMEAARDRLNILCWTLWATCLVEDAPNSLQGGWTSWSLRGPFQIKLFYDAVNAFCLPWDKRRVCLYRLPLKAMFELPQKENWTQGQLSCSQTSCNQHTSFPAAGTVRVAAFWDWTLNSNLKKKKKKKKSKAEVCQAKCLLNVQAFKCLFLCGCVDTQPSPHVPLETATCFHLHCLWPSVHLI